MQSGAMLQKSFSLRIKNFIDTIEIPMFMNERLTDFYPVDKQRENQNQHQSGSKGRFSFTKREQPDRQQQSKSDRQQITVLNSCFFNDKRPRGQNQNQYQQSE